MNNTVIPNVQDFQRHLCRSGVSPDIERIEPPGQRLLSLLAGILTLQFPIPRVASAMLAAGAIPWAAAPLAAQEIKAEPTRHMAKLNPGMVWHVEELPAAQSLFAPKPPPRAEATGNIPPPAWLIGKYAMGKNLRREEKLDSQGHWHLSYLTPKYLLTEQKDGTFTIEATEKNEELDLPKPRPDRLAEFLWIEELQPASATRMVDGVACWIFAVRGDGTPFDSAAEPGQKPDRIAAIGIADMFPRRLEEYGKVLRYTPQAAQSPAELPAGAQATLKDYEEKLHKVINKYALPR